MKAEKEENAMRISDGKLAMKLRLAATGLIMAGAATLAAAGPSTREEAEEGPALLALGDSVSFGFITQAGFEYVNPNNFIGYPAYVAAGRNLKAVNASCPGETTGSFISGTLPDNGCRSFRAAAPLHVAYSGSQLAFATTFLETHPQTLMVTIGLGANDLLLLRAACSNVPTCIQAGLPAVLAGVSSNMDTILRRVRATGFSGALIVVNVYSPDYTNTLDTEVLGALGQTLSAVASIHGAVVADAFSAFQKAASTNFASGKTCMTGLLNASPENQYLCDIHPSQSGQQLLADVVEAAAAE
jgi:lysophospholipase L1-like esterase